MLLGQDYEYVKLHITYDVNIYFDLLQDWSIESVWQVLFDIQQHFLGIRINLNYE